MSDSSDIKRSSDPDMRNAEIAIQRAAQLAREKARRFNHGIIITRDGGMVEVFVSETVATAVPVDDLMRQISLR